MPHLDLVVVVIISTIIEVEEGIITEEEVMVVEKDLMPFHSSIHHTLPIRINLISFLQHHSFKVPRMRDHPIRYVERVVIQLLTVTVEWIMLTKESILPLN